MYYYYIIVLCSESHQDCDYKIKDVPSAPPKLFEIVQPFKQDLQEENGQDTPVHNVQN